MEIRDYNGCDRWSRQSIINRYHEYCRKLAIPPQNIRPNELTNGNVTWVYPVMREIIAGIEAGDMACVEMGVDFVEEDARFPFGKSLKSNTARALRRASLSDVHVHRLRKRIVRMLIDGNTPHEYKEYAKLLRKIGIGSDWERLENSVNLDNKFVKRWFEYYRKVFVSTQNVRR
jgi:hypothetical protein